MDLLDAVADERRRMADLLDSLTPAQLDAPSLCYEWTVREVFAHLYAAVAVKPAELLKLLPSSRFSVHRANARLALRVAETPAAEIAAGLREHARNPFKPPIVGYAGQLTDLQVHGQDVRRPLGLPHGLDADRVRVSLDFLTGGRAVGFTPRRRLRGLRLETTDLDWWWGNGPIVAGPSEALIMALTGRSAVLSDLDGNGVRVLRSRLKR